MTDPILRPFDRLARRCPDAALVFSAHQTATISEVDAHARSLEHLLDEHRLPAGAIVSLHASNGPGFLAALIALRRAELAALPLDAGSPRSESLRIASSLGAAGLLRCRGGPRGHSQPWARDASGWEWCDLAPPGEERAPRCLPEAAVVKLTSGSTGAPRGIAVPAAALAADEGALHETMGLRARDRLLAAVPMSHSYGLSSLALPALLHGLPLVVPDETGLFAPFAAAERDGATVLATTPAYLDALLRVSQAPAWPRRLRLVVSAGAPLSPATASRFRATFGRPVHVFYGASECGGICFDREGGAGERGTVGPPVAGVRITFGEPGDGEGGLALVTVESPAVAAGYVPDEEPSRLGGGRFVSGDLAAWRHGELVLGGRLDALINVKGHKVNPREVERVLEQLEGVEEAVVLGVRVPERAGEVLRAVVACRPGRLDAGQVLAWCRAHLSSHKVPRSLILVSRMPRTPRGKVDRPVLLELGGGAGGGRLEP